MSSSSLSSPQIPLDHSYKQLLFYPSSPARTVSWAPSFSSLHERLLAVGHAQGVSIYRPLNDLDTSNSLDRAEAFRKRWSVEHICDGTLGTPVTKISWAPTSTYNPSSESSITLITLSTDHTGRMIYFPPNGGTVLTLLGGTSGHRSFINDVDCIIHPNATEPLTNPPTNEDLVIATVGDDNTLIIWQWQDSVVVPVAYSLNSPGVSVRFCKHLQRRLLVAEEEGVIRLLDWLASDDARANSSGAGASTLWLLNIYMGVGLSIGVGGFLASAEWCGEDIDGEGGKIVAVTRGGEWAIWDLIRIEGGGRTIPIERGQVIHASNVVQIRSHPSEPTLFAIASKATHETSSLHVVDLVLENQTNIHPIHSLPSATISITSLSWHPSEPVLAATLSSGIILLTRIGERFDGEKLDRQKDIPGDLIVTNGFHEEYDEDGPLPDVTLEDSFISRRGDEMVVDEE